MSTNGDFVRPLFPGRTLPDTTKLGVLVLRPVGPAGGEVRDALVHVLPGVQLADDDWLVVIDDTQTLGDQVPQVGLLDDDFPGTALNTALWFVAGGVANVSAGDLHLKDRGFIRSLVTAPAVGHTFTAKGLTIPSGSSHGLLVEYTGNQSGNRLWISVAGSTLGCSILTSGGAVFSANVTFDPVAHKNLRIREAAGTVYFEGSPDATTWTVLKSAPTPAWASGDCNVTAYGGVTGGADFVIGRLSWA